MNASDWSVRTRNQTLKLQSCFTDDVAPAAPVLASPQQFSACGPDQPLVVSGLEGQLQSPSDGEGKYENQAVCSWKIVLPSDAAVSEAHAPST